MPRHRGARDRMFVITDYEHLDKESFVNFYASRGQLRYACGGNEECPTTKRPHMQGLVYFDNQVTVATLGKDARNWAKAKSEFAHVEDAIGYCAKGTRESDTGNNRKYLDDPAETFWEHGERPKQGHRSDLDTLAARINGGTTVSDILQESPAAVHLYGRTLNLLEDEARNRVRRYERPEAVWFWGDDLDLVEDKALENVCLPEAYFVPHDLLWWDDYKQQDVVIIRAHDGYKPPLRELVELAGRLPYSVPRRNRSPMSFISKRVLIVADCAPKDAYEGKNLTNFLKCFQVVFVEPPKRNLQLRTLPALL